jgi:hypothetical protein
MKGIASRGRETEHLGFSRICECLDFRFGAWYNYFSLGIASNGPLN